MRPKYMALGYTPYHDSPTEETGWSLISYHTEKAKIIRRAKVAQKEWARHVVVVKLDQNSRAGVVLVHRAGHVPPGELALEKKKDVIEAILGALRRRQEALAYCQAFAEMIAREFPK